MPCRLSFVFYYFKQLTGVFLMFGGHDECCRFNCTEDRAVSAEMQGNHRQECSRQLRKHVWYGMYRWVSPVSQNIFKMPSIADFGSVPIVSILSIPSNGTVYQIETLRRCLCGWISK